MATTSSVLFDGLDAINYSDGYAHTSADTPESRIDETPADIRYKNAPAGTKISAGSLIGLNYGVRPGPNIFGIDAFGGSKAMVDSINCLSASQKISIYGSIKSMYTPMYASSDEAYFNYLKGYVGSFLYSPFDWYHVGDDVGFFDFFNLTAGNAAYQFIDQAASDETFWEATLDWWQQQKGIQGAFYDSADIRDELRDTYTVVELAGENGGPPVHVVAGFDSDGNLVVDIDSKKSGTVCNQSTGNLDLSGLGIPTLTMGGYGSSYMINIDVGDWAAFGWLHDGLGNMIADEGYSMSFRELVIPEGAAISDPNYQMWTEVSLTWPTVVMSYDDTQDITFSGGSFYYSFQSIGPSETFSTVDKWYPSVSVSVG